MIAGPAMRSRPVCQGVAASAALPAAGAQQRAGAGGQPRQPDQDERDDGQPETGHPPAAVGQRHRGHPEQDPEDDGDDAAAEPAQRTRLVGLQGRAGVRVVGGREHAAMLSAAARLHGRRSVDRMPTDPPATLAAWLRTRSDEQLSALLAARPDVARPAPSDVVALASRLAVPVSVDRALDELDAATLQVLDVVLLAPTDGVAPDELVAALPDVPDDVLAGRPGPADHPGAALGRRRPARPRPGAPRRPAPGRTGPPGHRAARPAARRPGGRRSPSWTPEEREVLERLAGERPVGHLPDSPPTAAAPRPAGCCSAGCWPASTR